MGKTSTCDHLVGYIGSDDANASLIRASQHYTFSDFSAEGMMFQFCPFCGQKIKWIDPEADSSEE